MLVYSMISSIMANTTLDQQKNSADVNASTEEVESSQQNGQSSVMEADHSNEKVCGSGGGGDGDEKEAVVVKETEEKTDAEKVMDGDANVTPAGEENLDVPVVVDNLAHEEASVEVKEAVADIRDDKDQSGHPKADGEINKANGDVNVKVNGVVEVNKNSDIKTDAIADVDGHQDEELDEDGDGEGEDDIYVDADGDIEGEGEGDVDGDGDGDIDGEEGDLEGEQVPETKAEKQLDHDQDRRNPQYIPKGGAFYEHDNRTSAEDVKTKDSHDVDKKKKVWKESKESERWLHDWYRESEQQPKTKAEIMETYGYDIRNEEAPPRARRRRKYGRGPDKYERNWEDEQAYMVKQNVPARRGKKKSFGKEEFPPLPNQKNDSGGEKTSPKSSGWKKDEEIVKRTGKMNNYERSRDQSSQVHRNEYSRNDNRVKRESTGGGGDQVVNSNRKTLPPTKKIIKDEIKPFRQYDKTKWKSNSFRGEKPKEIFKSNRSKPANQGESQTPRSVESNRSYSGDSDVAHVTEGFNQMTFHNKHSNMRETRQESTEIGEQEMDSPANRLNPKRYSKNRKGFTGLFPAEDIVEIDPVEVKQLQAEQQQKSQHVSLQQQPLNIQSVIRRYPGAYNGNPGYMAPRPIIAGIPQQGMSPQSIQQALSPQGIPQQALSPQVPGLQIELQQGPIPPQPNFVPPIYIDMDHYAPSEMMAPYTGYAPYSASQPGEMYQPSGGITYYNPECQSSNQIRAPPPRRQKSAIPILPPTK